jgi:hypothetical protein
MGRPVARWTSQYFVIVPPGRVASKVADPENPGRVDAGSERARRPNADRDIN